MGRKMKSLILTVFTVAVVFMIFSLAAFAVTANPTASTVLVDGRDISFEAYNINDFNYFKLRDLAFTLNGSAKQFEVGWDDANNAISLTSGRSYTVAGGEMAGGGRGAGAAGGAKDAAPTNSRIFLNGSEVRLTAYNIDGYNYFKLRDVGEAIDFGVDWDDSRNTIAINTSKGYSADGGGTTESPLSPIAARAVLQAWVESHPFQLGAVLEEESSAYQLDGIGYYRFTLSIIRFSGVDILVNQKTGDIFHLESPLSNSGFEPINDWYNREHAEYAPAISAGRARAIYNTWLESHTGLSEYTLNRESFSIYEANGEYYYWFQAENMEWYWYNILVSFDTGELLFLMTPDGEDPVDTIEPLDDWYNTYY